VKNNVQVKPITLAVALGLSLANAPAHAGFPAVVQLSALNGSNGFRLDGVADVDQSGFSVSAAGDINGDGIADLIVGAPFAGPNHNLNSGSSYVVFGKSSGFVSNINLSTLDGSTGFRLDGVAFTDYSGHSLSAAGDVNGDGVDDLIIGADQADSNGNSVAGSSYVVFGNSSGFASSINLSTLNGSTGFRLDGVASYDHSGRSVSGGGDINGDGIADLIIGAPYAGPNGDASGSSYVVFGNSSGFASSISLSTLNGSTGFRLDGVAADDFSGNSVSAAGDINGDSIADLIIGARGADPNGNTAAGSSYVVFGSSSGFASSINLGTLNGSTGFRLDGEAARDYAGRSVSATGDINGDGIDDLVIGAFGAKNGSYSGSSYVVFGNTSGFASSINLSTLDGSTGFRLDGVAPNDQSGRSVSGGGDINGDGIADLIVGAVGADYNGSLSGSSYVVFGNSGGFAPSINLGTLNGSTGFRLDGVVAFDRSGYAVSGGGDVNGDGIADLIVGAYGADHNGNSDSGSSYVVFGRATVTRRDFDADTHADILWRHRVSGNNALWLMNGRSANKGPLNRVAQAAQKIQGVGDFDGDGKADIFWRNTAIGTNSIWLMNGRTPSFGPTQTVANLDFNVAGIGDFDGDGKDDVLWRNATTGANSIWLMNGRTPSTGPVNATATSWDVGGVGDFDGDGKADILWRNRVNGRNSIWLMNGRTISFGATSQVANLNVVVSGIGDFDGDGKDDILWRNNTSGVNPLWLMNGRTPSFGTTSTVANLDLTVVQTSDFDGDGKADILWRNLTTGDNSMWLMNGRTASFGAISRVADLNWEVVP